MTFPAQFNVTDLNGINGFDFIDDSGDVWFGQFLSSLGDINNDGKPDLMVVPSFSNQAYVLFGANHFPVKFYTSSLNGTNGFRIIGDSQVGGLGCASAGIGDINGDGIDDLSVGPCQSANPEAFVVFGAKSFPPRLSLANLDGKNGFKINGADQGFGGADNLGDINGDGRLDFILSNDGIDHKVAFVIYGTPEFPPVFDLSSLNGSNGFTIVWPYPGSAIQVFVAGIGDFNGDTKPDFIIGLWPTGQAFVIFGSNEFPALMYLSSLNGTNGFKLIGPGSFGGPVAGVGDVNGDHLPDFGVGRNDEYGCEVFLIFGARHFNATFDASGLDGSNGVKLVGSWGSGFGRYLAGAGLINHNGKSGVIVGAPYTGAGGFTGSAFIFFGSDHFPPTLNISSLNGINGFEVVGPLRAALGYGLVSIDNFAGDNRPAIMIGALVENTTYVILDASIL